MDIEWGIIIALAIFVGTWVVSAEIDRTSEYLNTQVQVQQNDN